MYNFTIIVLIAAVVMPSNKLVEVRAEAQLLATDTVVTVLNLNVISPRQQLLPNTNATHLRDRYTILNPETLSRLLANTKLKRAFPPKTRRWATNPVLRIPATLLDSTTTRPMTDDRLEVGRAGAFSRRITANLQMLTSRSRTRATGLLIITTLAVVVQRAK